MRFFLCHLCYIPHIFKLFGTCQVCITVYWLISDNGIPYTDSFAAALAKIKNCALLSGDPELKTLENEKVIAIEWLK